MRVPVVFGFRVFLIALLVSAALRSFALAAQTPPAVRDVPAATRCDDLVRFWDDDNGVLAVDRQPEIGAGLRATTYRLDDKNGYWLFPATTDSRALISLPEGIEKSFNLSIAQVTTADGIEKSCAPFISIATYRGERGRPSFDGPSVARLIAASHTAEPAPCEQPFVPPSVLSAVAPAVPPLAMAQGITGVVDVAVDLDANGRVTAMKILRSPSVLVNNAAIDSARMSQYAPALFRCKPIPSHYMFTVAFVVR